MAVSLRSSIAKRRSHLNAALWLPKKINTGWINSTCCLCSVRCVEYCFYFNLSGHNECVNPYVVKC
ncbi:hypothetical protein ETS21_22930 [Vibrio parahaemolyticus]|nr:hypothetical protein [Vibrio parahaemolyticus]